MFVQTLFTYIIIKLYIKRKPVNAIQVPHMLYNIYFIACFIYIFISFAKSLVFFVYKIK